MQRLHILVSISLQKGERALTTIGPFAIDGDFDERHLDAIRKLLEKPFPWHVFEGEGWTIYFDADATSYLSGVIRGSTINVWGPWHEPNPAYKGQHKRDGHPWAIAHEVGHALDKTIQKSSRNFRDDIHEVMHDGAPHDHMRSTRDVPAPDEPNPDGLHGWNSSGRTPHDAAAGEAFAEWFAWMLGYVTTGKLSHGKHTWHGENHQEAIQDIVDDAIITELESRDTDPKEPEPEPEEPKEPMPTEPDTTDVNIKGKKFELTGTNIYRSRDTLVLYTRTEHQSFVPTNRWGIEVVVRDGVIVDIVNRLSTGAKAPEIPENGYVLSGHGKGYDWLSRIASIGDIVSSPGFEREVPAVEEKPRIPDSVIRKLEEIRKSVDDLILEIKSY